MKKTLILLLLTLVAYTLQAQVPPTEPNSPTPPALNAEEDEEEVIQYVETSPEFPGGTEALMQYIADNIQYPDSARANKIEGTVFIQFVVEADGSLTNFKLCRDIGYGCGEEALRVVQSMPRWVPGDINGRKTRSRFTLPIMFRLNE